MASLAQIYPVFSRPVAGAENEEKFFKCMRVTDIQLLGAGESFLTQVVVTSSESAFRNSRETLLWRNLSRNIAVGCSSTRRYRSGSYPNARTLAEGYEVSDKTIKRDLEYLRDSLDAPVEYDTRKRGYYYSDPHYRFSIMHITERDLFALYIAEKVLQQYRGTQVYDRPGSHLQPARIVVGKEDTRRK